MKRNSLLIICFFIALFSVGQSKEQLFSIDGHPYYTDEFLRVYNKNLDLVKDDSQKDLDKYFDLFLGYKLKVEKAHKIGLQNNTKYISELNSYRNQLAKSYLNDSKVTESLMKEAYDRMKYEVKASHILVLVDERATPEDTLKAYKRILNAKRRIEKGEEFDIVAMETSEDPSVKENKGDLGYFSAFRMVYPFENAAYNTSVGVVSKPFRTRFGYHILKVTDKRENRGEVTIAHIMILKPNDKNDSGVKEKQKIEEIYKKIQQGEKFEELAKQFSEDKTTALKEGLMPPFGSGQLTSIEFENQAFGLSKKGEMSEPFESHLGWHIIKLVEKHPVKKYEDLKTDLENKIKRDERAIIITNSLAKKVRGKYKVETDNSVLAKVKSLVTEEYYSQTWILPSDRSLFEGVVANVDGNHKLEAADFAKYLFSQQKNAYSTRPLDKLINEIYEKWLDEKLMAFYDQNLENEFPEFKYVMDEYRDGLLLFDLMEKEIWNKSKTDTLGLESFQKVNLKNYMWKKRYEVDILSSTDQKVIKKSRSLLKKGKTLEEIKKQMNTDSKVNVIEKSGIFEEDYDVLPKFENKNKGVTSIIENNGYYFVALIKDVQEERPKTIEECKGKLVSDYQQFLEDNWVSELKKEFTIKVNKEVFEKLKSQIKK